MFVFLCVIFMTHDPCQVLLKNVFIDLCVGGKGVRRGHAQSLRSSVVSRNSARGVSHFSRVDSLSG